MRSGKFFFLPVFLALAGCIELNHSIPGNQAVIEGQSKPVSPSPNVIADASAAPAPVEILIPSSSPSNCIQKDNVTTCEISQYFSLTLDLKSEAHNIEGFDHFQLNGERLSFKPLEILVTLDSLNGVNDILKRFDLTIQRELARISQNGPFFFIFESQLNNRHPDLSNLSEVVDKVEIKGIYRFFTNSGVNLFLKSLEMQKAGKSLGIVNAGLNSAYVKQ